MGQAPRAASEGTSCRDDLQTTNVFVLRFISFCHFVKLFWHSTVCLTAASIGMLQCEHERGLSLCNYKSRCLRWYLTAQAIQGELHRRPFGWQAPTVKCIV